MVTTIAPLALEDAAVLGRLQNSLWRATYAGLLPDEVLAARDDETSVRRWQERAGRSSEGARTLVAHVDGEPVGWVSTDPPRDTELWSLYVATAHHGSGVAVRLLEAVLPSSTAAHVWVVRGNERAIAFYRREGFAPDGAIQHDELLGADELRMVRG